jgi:DNA-binding transcriptional MerR regulator
MTPSEIVNKEYTLSEIARILKVRYENLRYCKRIGLISLSEGRRKYVFSDLLHLRIVVDLVNQGLAPNKIKAATDKMRSMFDNIAHPFNKVQVFTDGSSVFIKDKDHCWMEAHTGQYMIFLPVADFLGEVTEFFRLREAS